MILITEIRPYKRTKLFEVYSEEQMEFLASEKFLLQHEIARGETFDDEEFETIRAKAHLLDGIRKATDILSRKDYSKKELIDKLTQKNVPRDAAVAAVDFMASKGYQDDYRYARRLAEVAAGSYGRRRAEQILYQHGIDRETSAEVLDEVYSGADRETEKIDEILRKITKGSELKDPASKQKIYAKLARLGYDPAAISAAFSRYEPDGKDEFL